MATRNPATTSPVDMVNFPVIKTTGFKRPKVRRFSPDFFELVG